jgi:hypothetical protein
MNLFLLIRTDLNDNELNSHNQDKIYQMRIRSIANPETYLHLRSGRTNHERCV